MGDDLDVLEARVRDLSDTMPPSLRGALGLIRTAGTLWNIATAVAVPFVGILGIGLAATLGVTSSPGLTAAFVVGALVGWTPALARRPLLVVAHRWLLRRLDGGGLQAVGGATSVALPSWTPAKPTAQPMIAAAPTWVAPVRPPPRVGDPDAEDFDDD